MEDQIELSLYSEEHYEQNGRSLASSEEQSGPGNEDLVDSDDEPNTGRRFTREAYFTKLFRINSLMRQLEKGINAVRKKERIVPACRTFICHLPEKKVEKRGCRCVVCLIEMPIRVSAVWLPCGHFFHKACISKWLSKKNRCPLCRKTVPLESSGARFQRYILENLEVYNQLIEEINQVTDPNLTPLFVRRRRSFQAHSFNFTH